MHVLCAVPMYAFWWDKPLGVRHSVDLAPLISEFCETSVSPSETGAGNITPFLNNIETLLDHSTTEVTDFSDNGFFERLKLFWKWIECEEDLGHAIGELVFETYDEWHKTFQLWPETPAGNDELRGIEDQIRIKLGFEDQIYLHTRSRMASIGNKDNESHWLVLVILSVLYGAAHVAAWNAHFPSTVEMILWRISSVSTGTFFISTWAGIAIAKLRKGQFDSLMDNVIVILLILNCLVFIPSRFFLTLESFLSLRSLAKGSFETVSWSNYWPHF